MKVVIKAESYRDRYGADHKRGDVVEYGDELAAKLIGLGVAEAVPEKKAAAKVETAEAAPPENAAARTAKPKPRTRKGPQ